MMDSASLIPHLGATMRVNPVKAAAWVNSCSSVNRIRISVGVGHDLWLAQWTPSALGVSVCQTTNADTPVERETRAALAKR